jgi:serine/threonine protein kinase
MAGNVMLVSDSSDPRGYVAKLADAGLTPLLDLTRAKTSRRVHRRLRYLAPETQRDMRTDIATFAADIWSFSMVMYQCIAGRRPFADVDLPTFYSNVITPGGTLRPDFLHVECLERCKYLMEKCWQENPAARPTAADLVADLQAQLGDVLSQDHLF